MFSMGSAKVRNALFSVFSLVILMVHSAAACLQEHVADKAGLSANNNGLRGCHAVLCAAAAGA